MSKELREEVREKLQALGGNSKEVADTLYKGGYKGVSHDPSSCPVARFLQDKVDPNLKAQTAEIMRYDSRKGLDLPLVEMPIAVKQFIKEFDDGNFLKLRRY